MSEPVKKMKENSLCWILWQCVLTIWAVVTPKWTQSEARVISIIACDATAFECEATDLETARSGECCAFCQEWDVEIEMKGVGTTTLSLHPQVASKLRVNQKIPIRWRKTIFGNLKIRLAS